MKNRRPSLFILISQMHEKETVSLTSLIVSFFDWGCFMIEFDIMQSANACKLTWLSSL